MDLTKLKTIDEGLRKVRVVSTWCSMITGLAFFVTFMYQNNRIATKYSKILVVDISGKICAAISITTAKGASNVGVFASVGKNIIDEKQYDLVWI